MITNLTLEGFKSFVENIDDLISDYNLIEGWWAIKNKIGQKLENCPLPQTNNRYYLCLVSEDDVSLKNVSNTSISVAIEQKNSNPNEKVLLLNIGLCEGLIDNELSILEEKTYPKDLILIKIPTVSNLEEIEELNRERVFKHNTKHDYVKREAGVKPVPKDRKWRNGDKVNRLLFPEDKMQEYAEKLIEKAITDRSTDKLYNIDNFNEVEGGKGLLIEFMPEQNVPNTYHAYHLEDIKSEDDVEVHLPYLSSDLKNRLKKMLREFRLNQR